MCLTDAMFELSVQYSLSEDQIDLKNTIVDDNFDSLFEKYQTPEGMIAFPQFKLLFFDVVELLNSYKQEEDREAQNTSADTGKGAMASFAVAAGSSPQDYASQIRAQIEEKNRLIEGAKTRQAKHGMYTFFTIYNLQHNSSKKHQANLMRNLRKFVSPPRRNIWRFKPNSGAWLRSPSTKRCQRKAIKHRDNWQNLRSRLRH